jgi:hypothetical protein
LRRTDASTSAADINEQPTAPAATYDNSLSAPLYLSGLVGSLAALAALNSALGVDSLSVASSLLDILGFTFSYACRWSGIKSKPVDVAALLLTGFLVFRVATGGINVGDILPVTQSQGDLQMAVVLEWLSIIFAWTLLDDRKVVMSSILSIAMIGLVAAYDLNVELMFYFLLYVVATIFLLIHQNYLLHRTWSTRSAASPFEWRVLSSQLVIATVCSTIVMFCAAVLVVPLQAVGSHLSLASAIKGLVDLGHGTADPLVTPTQFTDEDTFSIGQGNSTAPSSEEVMVVVPSDRQEHYWRGRTYDEYSTQGWRSTRSREMNTLELTPTQGDDSSNSVNVPPGLWADGGTAPTTPFSRLVTRFRIIGGETDTLYTPAHPTRIDFPAAFRSEITVSQDGEFQLNQSVSKLEFRVLSDDYEPKIAELQHVDIHAIPDQIAQTCILQRGSDVSASDSARLAQTAAGIVASLPTDRRDEFDVAEQIKQWVAGHVEYSDIVPPIPPDVDPVSYFLFTSKVGYCDMFATSMAILCRYAGVPARVATGFLHGEEEPDGSFHVRLMDKHAWCEVYFPKYGWYVFDPTEGATLAPASQDATNPFAALWNTISTRVRLFLETNGPLPIAVVVIASGAVAFLVKTEVIDRYVRRRNAFRSRFSGSSANVLDHAAYEIARSAAAERWKAVQDDLSRRRFRQAATETTHEFVDRAVALFCAIDEHGRSSARIAPPAEIREIIRSLSALANAFLLARYADESDAMAPLIERERDGLAEAESRLVHAYVVWARKYAAKISADRPVELLPSRTTAEAEQDDSRTPAGVP